MHPLDALNTIFSTVPHHSLNVHILAIIMAHTTLLTEIAIVIVLQHMQNSNTAMALMPVLNF
jgi:hypothetical protein